MWDETDNKVKLACYMKHNKNYENLVCLLVDLDVTVGFILDIVVLLITHEK